jgi:hypothetical protein
MVLKWSLILSAGLFILGLAGIFGPAGSGSWLAWCDLLGAWAAYFIAADICPTSTMAQRIGGPLALSFGLFLAWFTIRGRETVTWLIWGTFIFACAFLALAICRRTKKERLP